VKFVKFEYQDLKGKVTNRECLVIQEPSDKVSTIDVTGLPDDDIADFACQYEVIREGFLAQIEALKSTYDLKHSFRTFFPDKMVVSLEETI